ncbi:MAG: 3-dehydroquinate dehydratase / shikimate dehydrogenase [Acidobacteriota bacterium]|nr:3-dehydroquinate dehydratase / shikimate dehydrogenase [Acidobacteriota bacterium]
MERPGTRATLIATLTAPPSRELEGLADADWLEVRGDLVGDLDPALVRRIFPGQLLYTLRSRAEGGAFEGSAERRKRRLVDAARRYDFVDLEMARDLVPEVLKAIPPERRVISWHGPATPLAGLQEIFRRMSGTNAALYKLVPAATQPGEELAPLLLLQGLERRDVTAFSTGLAGVWTRLIAPRFGAPVVYGAAGETPGAPGQPTIQQLVRDFGLPAMPPVSVLFGIVGNPVSHSLSPRIHNAAYRELGVPALYLPFHTESFGEFWLEVVESGMLEELGLPIRGLSVTAPYKEAALAVAGAESPRAGLIGAANTLVWNQQVWEAEATDPDGIVLPLRERGIPIDGRTAAVVGTGGAGRSAAAGLATAGARVTLVNRGAERGLQAATLLGLPFMPLADLDPSTFDILVNATSLGRKDGEALPFPVDSLRPGPPGVVVIDMVYGDGPTPLLREAAARGAVTVDGREVLLGQAVGQFRMMTGKDLPRALVRRIVGLEDLP